MKKMIYLLGIVIPAFVGCGDATNEETTQTTTPTVDTVATKQEEPAPPAPPMDSAAMMKAWQDYMTPGDMHKMLASWSGKWDGDLTMWMSPDAPPTKTKGTAEYKMILGGRYQESIHKSSFEGMPFEGKGITAYDNAKKVFISSWVDNMGTGIMHLEGPWDEASKSITLTGECVDPMTGQNMKVREVVKIIDDKHQTMEMYMTQGGKEYKSMEVVSTKK